MTTHTIDKSALLGQKTEVTPAEHVCSENQDKRMRAIRDTLHVVGGKWRIPIIGILSFKGKMRFTEILRSVEGIGAKMLSKELQDLEANQIITRTVKQTKPITVEYEITEYGLTLTNLLCEIVNWGVGHRERIMAPTTTEPEKVD